MRFDFDPAKDRSNLAKHGLSLADFKGFDANPLVRIDDRYDYGERRYLAFGRIGGLGHCLVFTSERGVVRLISWRRAHE